MSLLKPFKRTCRQFIDGSYANSGNWQYLHHNDFAQDPQHYIRAFMIIQKDLLNLFEYIEPSDQNLETYSFKIHELLTRTCIEVEANFTAILHENIFSKKGNLSINDYKIIDNTHHLSSYKFSLHTWKGQSKVRMPFQGWKNGQPLSWYQAYNKSKHDRLENFNLATFGNLLDAVGGLFILLSSQFHTEDYSPNDKGLGIGEEYSYGTNDGMEMGIGGYFRVLFPNDWTNDDSYSFEWHELEKLSNPIALINYDDLIKL